MWFHAYKDRGEYRRYEIDECFYRAPTQESSTETVVVSAAAF